MTEGLIAGMETLTKGASRGRDGFTLVELLTVVTLIAMLAALMLPVVSRMKASSSRAVSAHSLRQLIVAGHTYLGEHDNVFWKWAESTGDGVQWWWGWESSASLKKPEGEREIDYARGPLGPYLITAGGVKTDPGFLAFDSRLKPKYRNGNFGYGYNTVLAFDDVPWRQKGVPRHALQAERPGEVVVFATSAQVNTFQRPATAKSPMIEEFYMINEREVSVHFRHGGKAMVAFLDGNVREVEMDPATLDSRFPEARVGRFAPVGSMKYLW